MVFTTAQFSTRCPAKSTTYSLEVLRSEALSLVKRGVLRHNQPIFALCEHLPAREWIGIERTLEEGEFLLRDHISDLLATIDWYND